MYQFKIKGIDYTDESQADYLMHTGPGQPGRAKGSKNGQIDPRAVAMKYYDVVGKKAVGEPATPGAARRASTGSNQIKSYGGSSNRSATPASSRPKYGSATVSAKSTPTQRTSSTASMVTAGTAASKVERGKSMVESLTGSNAPASVQQRNRDMSTKELRDMDPVGDWPWSNRRVQAAGGLEAREGRQIVYDNPTLSDDYKKQVAKRFGDSDGKSFPKYLDGTPRQQEKATTVQEENSNEQKETQQDSGNQAATDSRITNAAQRIVGQRVDPASQGTNNTLNGVQAVGEPANVTGPRVETAANDIARRPSVPAGSTDVPQTQANNNQPAAQTQPQTQTRTQETPEQRSLWDNLGGWLGQAGKDIGDTVTSGLNAAGGAISNAAGWVGDRLRDAGDWAVASTGDVGQWVGDRARDLGNWWNGSDTYQQVADPNNPGVTRDVQSRQQGAGEQIGNFVNNVGQGIGNAATNAWNGISSAANNIGNGLNNWWNGSDTRQQVADPNNPGVTRDVQARQQGAGEQIGNFFNNVGQGIGNAWNGVTQGVGNAANNVANGANRLLENGQNLLNQAGQWVGNAANNAGQWIGDTANAAGQWVGNAANNAGQWIGDTAQNVNTFVNGPRPGSPESRPYFDLISGQWVDPMEQTLGDRVRQAVSNTAANARNWVNDNVVTPVNNAAEFVRDTANTAQAVTNAGGASNIASRAISAGVPIDLINHWSQNYRDGQIDERDYEDLVDRYLSNNASTPVNSSANDLGQRIGNAANDAQRTADEIWNGRNVVDYDQDFNEIHRWEPGLRDRIGLNGRIRPVVSSDGTTNDLYVPGNIDAFNEAVGRTPSYVANYYDQSNPNREAYWPATANYIVNNLPQEYRESFWNDPSIYGRFKYGGNPLDRQNK